MFSIKLPQVQIINTLTLIEQMKIENTIRCGSTIIVENSRLQMKKIITMVQQQQYSVYNGRQGLKKSPINNLEKIYSQTPIKREFFV